MDEQGRHLLIDRMPSRLGLSSRGGQRDDHISQEAAIGGRRLSHGKRQHIGCSIDLPIHAVQLAHTPIPDEFHAELSPGLTRRDEDSLGDSNEGCAANGRLAETDPQIHRH